MRELKLIEVPEKLFDKIIELFPSDVKVRDDIYNCFNGTPENKSYIYTDSREWIVCKEYILNYVSKILYNKEYIIGATEWKQVRLRKILELNHIQSTYNGSYCYNYLIKIIKKYYTEEDIDNIFRNHNLDVNDEPQFHYYYPADFNEIYEFNNCVKYDINGAHAKALIDMFPKAQKDLLQLYNKKKKYKDKKDYENANKIKAIFNYAVGELCNKGYRGTYNYIVNSVTKQLKAGIKEVDGLLLYANTDGFIVSTPNNKLPFNKELGNWKLEAEGNMYIYRDNNYWIIEYTTIDNEKEQKGSCKIAVRDKIDLSKGKVVHYRVNRTLVGEGENSHYVENIENIKEEIINEKRK